MWGLYTYVCHALGDVVIVRFLLQQQRLSYVRLKLRNRVAPRSDEEADSLLTDLMSLENVIKEVNERYVITFNKYNN